MIEALITGAAAMLVCMVNNSVQSKAVEKQHDKTVALIDYKLEELTKKVEKHNDVVSRTYVLEQKISVHEEKLKVAGHRIDDLEEGAK